MTRYQVAQTEKVESQQSRPAASELQSSDLFQDLYEGASGDDVCIWDNFPCTCWTSVDC